MHFQRLNFQSLLRPLQAGVIASAAFLMLPATAQMPPPASAPAEATTAAPMPQPAVRPMQRKHYRGDGHRHPRLHRAGPRHTRADCMQDCRDQRQGAYERRHSGDGAYSAEPANVDRLVNDRPHTMTEYERNALARCDVFKTRPEHRACVERLQRPAQGSVEGGGLLREYSYEVPAEPR